MKIFNHKENGESVVTEWKFQWQLLQRQQWEATMLIMLIIFMMFAFHTSLSFLVYLSSANIYDSYSENSGVCGKGDLV